MFRDRDQELERLNRELLEEDEEEEAYEEDEEDDEDADEEEYEEAEQPDYHAYNTDTADVDLEEYSREVYTAPRRGCGLAAVFALVTAGVLLLLAYLLAKQGGLI